MLGGTVMLFFGAANLYVGASRNHFRFIACEFALQWNAGAGSSSKA
jgi:hypothetical protein